MARIALLLVVKHAGESLCELLAAVSNQVHLHEMKILAVDSGSTDRTLEILKRHGVRAVTIPPPEFNHGSTRNLAAREAGSGLDYLVYLSQDAIPADKDWLANLIRPLEEDPRVAGAFSRHIPPSGTSPSLTRQLTRVWQTGGAERLVNEMPEDPETYVRDRVYYATFSNTSSVIRRSVWEEIPFRELNFAEDADWADRVIKAGYKIVFEPDSNVLHAHDYSIIEQFRQNVDHTEAMIRLFDPPVFHDRWLLARQILSVPRAVWRDVKFMRRSPLYRGTGLLQQGLWVLRSPFWHLASHLGTWVGARLERMPDPLKILFRRQERLKRGVQDR
jgi:rhamnosyltransferase